jgi:hypothetical protein
MKNAGDMRFAKRIFNRVAYHFMLSHPKLDIAK